MDVPDLLLGGIEGTGVVDDKVGRLYLFFIGNLSCHAANHLGAGCFFRHPVTGSKALNALFRTAAHDDQPVESVGGSSFENQSSFHHPDGTGISLGKVVHPSILVGNDGGMDNRVEFFDSHWSTRPRHAESKLGELWAVDGRVGIQDFTTEVLHHLEIDILAGLQELVRYVIRKNDVNTKAMKHFAYYGFSTGDTAGQANSQHEVVLGYFCNCVTSTLRRSLAALRVLAISMAIVNGPTPPGTGVRAPATSATSG